MASCFFRHDELWSTVLFLHLFPLILGDIFKCQNTPFPGQYLHINGLDVRRSVGCEILFTKHSLNTIGRVTSTLAVPVIRTVPGRSTGTGGAVKKTGPTGRGAIRRLGPLVVWVRVWDRFLDVGQLPIAGSGPSGNQDPTRTDYM